MSNTGAIDYLAKTYNNMPENIPAIIRLTAFQEQIVKEATEKHQKEADEIINKYNNNFILTADDIERQYKEGEYREFTEINEEINNNNPTAKEAREHRDDITGPIINETTVANPTQEQNNDNFQPQQADDEELSR